MSGADELARVLRHHHIHQRARLLQLADEIGCLIRRDAAADAEDDMLLSIMEVFNLVISVRRQCAVSCALCGL